MSACHPHLFVTLRDGRTRDAWLDALKEGDIVDDDAAFVVFDDHLLADDPDLEVCEADGARGLRLFTTLSSFSGATTIEALFDDMRAQFGGAVEEMLCAMLDTQTGTFTLLRLRGSALETGTVNEGDEAYAPLRDAEPAHERDLLVQLLQRGTIMLDAMSSLTGEWEVP